LYVCNDEDRGAPGEFAELLIQIRGTHCGSAAHALAMHRSPSALEVDAAEEPEDKQDNQNQAQNAPQARSTIASIAVVTSTSAEKQDEHDNYHN
jgi:hypothetical protein